MGGKLGNHRKVDFLFRIKVVKVKKLFGQCYRAEAVLVLGMSSPSASSKLHKAVQSWGWKMHQVTATQVLPCIDAYATQPSNRLFDSNSNYQHTLLG